MQRLILTLFACLLWLGGAYAAELRVAYVGRETPPRPTLSFLDPVLTHEVLAGVRVALSESEVTARFTGKHIRLDAHVLQQDESLDPVIQRLAREADLAVIAALPGPELLRLADAVKPTPVINARDRADALRRSDCRANLLHTVPSHAMLADALSQFMSLKGWTRWAMVTGPMPEDALLADAFRAAAAKFGNEIVEEKPWTLKLGHGRADTGHVTLQSEIPVFTRLADHDVLVVADTGDGFGEYLSYRTSAARPVAGTHGLVVAGWSPVLDQWGAAQLQQRFRAATGRGMTEADYAGWLAMASVAEAVHRGKAATPAELLTYLTGEAFRLAGFKGQAQSFRSWDGQMRQPILLVGARLLVSVSPQPGFLQKGSDLDSLGDAAEEARCAP